MTYVYMISHPAGDFHKVGISALPQTRLRSIQSCSPFELSMEIICFDYSKEDALKIEQLAHAMLNQYAVRGEWFRAPKDTVGLKVVGAELCLDLFRRKVWTPPAHLRALVGWLN